MPLTSVRADVIAGLTTAAVVIPKAMAMAAIAGLALEPGLYTALVPPIVYAATGTSKNLSVTTTSTIAVLVAATVAQHAADGDSARAMAVASALALMVGGFLLLAGVLRLGFLANFISAPVLTGFKAGIAIVIVVDQLPKLLGIHFGKGSIVQNVAAIVQHVPDTSLPTLALASTLLVLISTLGRWLPRAPAPLVAVVLAIAASGLLALDRSGIELVGDIRAGLPSFTLPNAALALELWPAAMGIALMSFVETVAAGRAFARPGDAPPVPNRELLAVGLASVAGSAFYSMPAGGSTSQTAVNRAAGARTQAAGLVTAATALATLLFLAPFVSLMPQAALAAVVVTTSIGLFKPADFVAILRVRQMEFWWAVAATCGVVLLGTLNGILVAVALSVLILFYQANRPPVYVLGRRRDTGVFEALSPGEPDIETFPSLLIMRTEGRIYFANAFRIGEQMWPLIQESRPQIVALEMSAVPDLEYTALCGLTAAETQLRENGTTLWLVALNAGVREVIERAPLGRVLGRERIFATLDQAVAAHANAAEQRSAL